MGLPRERLALHEPVPRRRRPRRRRAVGGERPRSTGSSPRGATSPSPSSSPTAPRCCSPTRPPASSGPSTPAARDGRAASSAAIAAVCAGSGPTTVSPWSARRSAAAATRCREEMRADAAAASAPPRDGLVDRDPGHRRGRRRGRPARSRRRAGAAGSRAAPARATDLYSYRRDGCTGRFAGIVRLLPGGATRERRRDVAAGRAGRPAGRGAGTHRRGLRRGRTRPRRCRASWSSPSSSRSATSGCWPSSACATSGRTATRRPRRSGRRWAPSRRRACGALHRSAPEPTRPRRSPATPTSSSRSTGPSSSRRSTAAPHGGRAPQVAASRSAWTATPRRGGRRPDERRGLADAVAAHRQPGARAASWPWRRSAPTPDAAFARLREVAHGIRAGHPGATWVSAGMSGDLEAAVRHGATHLRVGSAILGSRPPLGSFCANVTV